MCRQYFHKLLCNLWDYVDCGLLHKGTENCSMPGQRCEVGRHTLKKLTGRSVISHVPLKEGSQIYKEVMVRRSRSFLRIPKLVFDDLCGFSNPLGFRRLELQIGM